jgi:GrpB-like predicted nucleotidyltransferase (UPF0157 family)
VSIQDYDPAWPEAFSKLAARVNAALGSLVVTIEHIGSTAVPGLAAKPIIDLDVVLASPADLPRAIRLLASIGYVHEGDLGIAGREAFRSPPGEPRHHLYVLATGATELRRHLAFRDALRASKDLRDRYSALKRSLADVYKDNRSDYTRGKTAFIFSIVGNEYHGDVPLRDTGTFFQALSNHLKLRVMSPDLLAQVGGDYSHTTQRQSQPFMRAMRAASTRLPAPSLLMASER